MREERREVCGRRVDGVGNVIVIVGEEGELKGPGVGDESGDDQDGGQLGIARSSPADPKYARYSDGVGEGESG